MTPKLGALVPCVLGIVTASWTCAQAVGLADDRPPTLDTDAIPLVSLLDRIPKPLPGSWDIEARGTSSQVQADSADAHWWDGFGYEQQGFDYWAYALTVYNGELIAGGFFSNAGRYNLVHNIARWDGRVWHSLGGGVAWASCGPLYPPSCWTFVYDLTVWNGNLVAGGKFLYAGGKRANYIARWDGSEWFPLGSGMDGPVRALGVYNGDLIASGAFALAGQEPVNYIARWDGTRWNPMGSGLNDEVRQFVVYQGDLIASGYFTRAGELPVGHIARWDGTSWHALGAESVYVATGLTVFEGSVIANVLYPPPGTIFVSRWDGTSWEPLTRTMLPGIFEMAEYNGKLIVAGRFDPDRLRNIARLEGDTWTPLGSGLDGPVYDLAVCNGSLYVAGLFEHAGGKPSVDIARWDDVITPVMLEDFAANSVPDGVRLDWRLSADTGSELQSVSVQRAEVAAGPYVVLEPSRLPPQPVMTFLDTNVAPGQRYWYRLHVRLRDGGEETLRPLDVLVPEMTRRTAYLYTPVEPWNGRPIELKFGLVGVSAPVRLAVYDVRGRILRVFDQGTQGAGEHSLSWDRLTDSGAWVSRGLYFVRLRVPGIKEVTKKLVLLHR